MTTEQRIVLLEQVQKIADINGFIFPILKDVSQKDFDLIKPVVLRLLEACDAINQACSHASVDIKIVDPCRS